MALYNRSESYPLSQITPEIARRLGLVEGSCDGVSVTEDTILSLGSLWRGCRVISEGVGNLPLKVYRRGEGNQRDEARDYYAWRLVHRRPHTRFSAQDFWTLMVWNAVLHGTGVATIERLGALATSLTPIEPWRVTYDSYHQQWFIDGKPHLYEDLIIINGPSPDGSMGYKLTRVAREAFAFFLSTERYGSAYFKNATQMGGWVEAPVGMSAEGVENIIKSLENRNRGVERAGGIGVLLDGSKYVANNANNEQSQYHESRERNALEIAKFLGVDPVLIFEQGNVAPWHNNVEGAVRFLTYTLNTYLNKIENELGEKVILPSDQDAIFVEFNRQAMLEMNIDAQSVIWERGIKNGWLEPNEVRSMLGKPPLAPKPEPAPAPQEDDNDMPA